MQFLVKDGSNGSPIEGAKVTVRKDADNSVAFSGTTDAAGKVDFAPPADVAHTLLAHKANAYDGSRVSVVNKGGVLYPASVSLLKVSSRVMKLSVFYGDFNTPLGGARVEVLRADSSSFLVATTGSDGKYQTTLPADLAGWLVVLTYPGLDGVAIPLDKIDLLGEVKVVFNPTIASDE